jgi:hypothetical protein
VTKRLSFNAENFAVANVRGAFLATNPATLAPRILGVNGEWE